MFPRSGWSEKSNADNREEKISGGDYSIPSELQETLLDFTVHYLVERPPDIIDFAMEYFSELQSKRNNAGMVNSEDEDMQSEEEDLYGENIRVYTLGSYNL